MARERKLNRQLNDQIIKKTKKFPKNNFHKISKKSLSQNSLWKSRSPTDRNKRKHRTKLENLPISGFVYCDTGNHVSKKRRRENRSSVSEPIPESSSAVPNPIDNTRPRPRRSAHADTNMSSSDDLSMASNSQQPNRDTTCHLALEETKPCLPSTSHCKLNNSPSKKTSKSHQSDISTPHDPDALLAGERTLQGIVPSGERSSHYQNYMAFRSLISDDAGERVNKKLDELRLVSGDRNREYALMSDINQQLLISYEDSLDSLRVGELANQVVSIIHTCQDELIDLRNICYNVLLHLMEALPDSSDCLVSSLGMFLDKISNLFDFDSLEQIINVIERVSRRHGHAVLQSGAFTIIFNYYDFLTAPQQLTILTMTGQCFDSLKPTDFNFVIDGIENLSNRLRQSEPKCVEKVIQCFVSLVTALHGDESKLKKLASKSLLVNLVELLISSPPIVSDAHVIVQMMATLCANCPDLAVDLIRQHITRTILSVYDNCHSRSTEQILSLVTLISELFPPLPLDDNPLFAVNRLIDDWSLSPKTENIWHWHDHASQQWVSHSQDVCVALDRALSCNESQVRVHCNGADIEVDLVTMEQTECVNGVTVTSDINRSRYLTDQSVVDARERWLHDQCRTFATGHLADLVRHLFPMLLVIYNDASSLQVRYKCLEAVLRIIHPTTTEVLDSLVNKVSLSSLMASLLASDDSTVVIYSIQMGTIMKKLPATLISDLKKEGVLHQLGQTLSMWSGKVCDVATDREASTSQLPDSNHVASRDQPDHDQFSRSVIAKLGQRLDTLSDYPQMTTNGAPSNPKQKITNWIMKRSGWVGRHHSSENNAHIGSKSRRHGLDWGHAKDMGLKTSSEPTTSSTSATTSHRINDIMSTLNLNSSLSNSSLQCENKLEKSCFDSERRELSFKRWILKFGTRLNNDWSDVGDDSLNEGESPERAGGGQSGDVICYLKEIASDLHVDNSSSNEKALTRLAELLATECYISVFEMECSSINEALLDFFTRPSRDRFLMFIDIFAGKSPGSRKPLLSLVSHLLVCLHQQEQFHVRTYQLPITYKNVESSFTRNIPRSHFSLSQAVADSVVGRTRGLVENTSGSVFETGLLLEPSYSRRGVKAIEVQCHLSPYELEIHPTDVENGVEFWSGEKLLGFNASFKVNLNVLATISSIEAMVMSEINRHRRLNNRIAVMSQELASLKDLSDSDVVDESFWKGSIDCKDDVSYLAHMSFSDKVVKKHNRVEKANPFIPAQMNIQSSGKKLFGKRSSLLKPDSSYFSGSSLTNPLSKKTWINKGNTKQLKCDPYSLMVTPTISSTVTNAGHEMDLHGNGTAEVVLRPISKIQILVEDVVLPSNMTLYHALRKHGSHVSKLLTNRQDATTSQWMEEAINQTILTSLHCVHFRPLTNIHTPSQADLIIKPTTSASSDTDRTNGLLHSKYKRRRKSNPDPNPSIGRGAVRHLESFFSNLTRHVPYPCQIDFPTIFGSTSVSSNAASVQRHHDLNSNMSQKLETTVALLRCLYAVNRDWHALDFCLLSGTLIPETHFRSQKLSAKLSRQLQDTFYVLAGNLPFWCLQLIHSCAFLFSLDVRQNFLYLCIFGRARTLLYLEGPVNQDSDTLFESSSTELRRVRVQVDRSDHLLEESELLLKTHTDPHILLEISFNNEAGFGLGPTNEFYTQVSACLMKSDLMMWYSSAQTSEEYVMPPPFGLFPRPTQKKNRKMDMEIRKKFVFLGRFMARALLDGRKIDLPLSPVFYKWFLGQQQTISSADMAHIDHGLFGQLKTLHDLVEKKLQIDGNETLSEVAKMKAYEDLCVEDLQIVFVHPIYTEHELIKDGANRVVTVHDLSLYLDLVASFTLLEGVRTQMESVLEGFDSLMPGARMHLSALFEPHEMEEIFCGGSLEDNQAWDVKTLSEVCVCDHGYTVNSRSIVNLFDIMSEFTREQRRHFLQFCTGTPRLPVGGFRAMKPPFKIVNKKEGGHSSDSYLPSVMTCQNFLKLPDYSTKEVMRERILYALLEGQKAFYLS